MNQGHLDPTGDEDGDGFYNAVDACPYDWHHTAPGCPTCSELLGRMGITDIDQFLADYNFGTVITCANGSTVYRCASPDEDLMRVLRICRNVHNVICLNGGIGGGVAGRIDRRCLDVSKHACEVTEMNFYNQCQIPVSAVGSVPAMQDLLDNFYSWSGNSLIHCLQGQDRTGVVSSLILALEQCRGLAEPQRVTCVERVRKDYLLDNPLGALDVKKYPQLLSYFDKCVSEVAPPLPFVQPTPTPPMPTPAPTMSQTPTPTPTPTPVVTPFVAPTPTSTATPIVVPVFIPTPIPTVTPVPIPVGPMPPFPMN